MTKSISPSRSSNRLRNKKYAKNRFQYFDVFFYLLWVTHPVHDIPLKSFSVTYFSSESFLFNCSASGEPSRKGTLSSITPQIENYIKEKETVPKLFTLSTLIYFFSKFQHDFLRIYKTSSFCL